MQINIEQEVLLKGVAHTLGVVDKRGTFHILSHCLVKTNGSGLIISATDLETSFRGFYPAEVKEDGGFAVQAQALNNLVKDLPKGGLEIYGDGDQMQLETGESRYKFLTLPAEEYPPIPEVAKEGMAEVEAKPLMEMIDKTIFSVGDDLQYHLQGIFWEQVEHEEGVRLRLVSTDGHRLSVAERPIPEVARLELGQGILVPAKAMREIKRFLEGYAKDATVLVGLKDKALCFKAGDKELSVRLLEKKFPAYRRIIPEKFQEVFFFNRQELWAAVKRISLLSRERFRGVIFTLGNGWTEVAHENPEVGTGRELVGILRQSGELAEPLKVGLNARYLLEALAVMKGEEVALELTDPDRPIQVKDPSDLLSFSLIMPMNL